MKITVEELNPVQRRVNLTISKDIVNLAFDKTFSDIQKKAQVQGFRPGKAPIKIIRKLYGERAAYDATDRLVKDNLFAALDKNEISPVAVPYLENEELAAYDQDYDVKVVIDVLPKIALNGAHKDLSVKVRELSVEESSVEKELKRLIRQRARLSPTEDNDVGASLGQMIGIEIAAFKPDGSQDPSQSSNGTEQYLMGNDEIISDFENAILGQKVGSVVKVQPSQTAPEIAQTTFELTIKSIQNAALPKLDDELAKDLGFEDLAKLRESIRNDMLKYVKNANENELLESLIKAIHERVEIAVPPALVDQNIDTTIRKILGPNNSKSAENFLKDEKIRSGLREKARKELQTSILLREIVRQEGLEQGLEEVASHDHEHDEHCSHDHEEKERESALLGRIREFLLQYANVEKEIVAL